MAKLTIVGAGNLGSQAAFYAASKGSRDERELKIRDRSLIFAFYVVMLVQSQLALIEILTSITFPTILVFFFSINGIAPIWWITTVIQRKVSDLP